MESERADMPWYRQPQNPIPFSINRKITSNDPARSAFTSVASFPWSMSSLSNLCDGSLDSGNARSQWTQVVQDCSGASVVGAKGRIYIMPRPGERRTPLCVRVPEGDNHLHSADIRCVAWAMCSLLVPEVVVLFAAASLLYVVDVRRHGIIGYLRGHGGPITSISVHPVHPYIICTTSRDFTTRIYDLTQTPAQYPNNPHWPPSKEPSMAGAAFGLQMSEPEGQGVGRCVAVLAGGRSGGHQAAVLGACFHPVLPLIATCGMDRAAKIWPIPSLESEGITREDKPFFSTTILHQARILSITWLSQDVLLTHSAPALLRTDPDDRNSEVYEAEGTLAIWRWLGVDRFFPPGYESSASQRIKRGCASDYQESASFKVISVLKLPTITRHLHVYQSPCHDPIVIVPQRNKLKVLNVCHLEPCPPPQFPFKSEIAARFRSSSSITLDNGGDLKPGLHDLSPGCWELVAPVDRTDSDSVNIEACEVSQAGRLITAVGTDGHIWIWRLQG